MKKVAKLVLGLVLASACAQAHKKEETTVTGEKPPFDVATAAAELGHPGAKVTKVEPDKSLPELWTIFLEGATPGDSTALVAIAHHGHLARGYLATGPWLHRIHIEQRHFDDPYQLTRVLGWLDAIPTDFGPGFVTGSDPQTGEKGGLTMKPFVLKLVTDNYRFVPETQLSRVVDGVELPAPGPQPTEGPGAPAMGPGPGAPPSPGPGAPPSAGPGGAPQRPSGGRAILRGDSHGKLVWTVESWSLMDKSWQHQKTIPLE